MQEYSCLIAKKSVPHLEHPVRHGRQVPVMGDDDDGLSEAVAEVEEKLVDVFLGIAVQVARGLVGQNDAGAVDNGSGNGYPLLLPAGEFGGLVLQSVAQSQGRKQLRCLPSGVGCALRAISAGIMTFSSAVNSGSRWWN